MWITLLELGRKQANAYRIWIRIWNRHVTGYVDQDSLSDLSLNKKIKIKRDKHVYFFGFYLLINK